MVVCLLLLNTEMCAHINCLIEIFILVLNCQGLVLENYALSPTSAIIGLRIGSFVLHWRIDSIKRHYGACIRWSSAHNPPSFFASAGSLLRNNIDIRLNINVQSSNLPSWNVWRLQIPIY